MTDPITRDDVLAVLETLCERGGLIALPTKGHPDRWVALSIDHRHTPGTCEFTVWDDDDRQVSTGTLRVDDLVDARPEPDWSEEAAIDAAVARRERAGDPS